ncbi:atrial natriuretic peptide receptor 1 [Octopus bimaculoides]|nr:atrial natriuretic peptide receptor 1 [Octopus bimaculoides]
MKVHKMSTKTTCYSCLTIFGILLSLAKLDHAVQTVYMAVIIPSDNSRLYSLDRTQPAITVALEKVRRTILTSDVEIVALYADSRCSSQLGPIRAFDFYSNKTVNVFFGPVCDYSLAPVARYAVYWNLPVVTPGAMAHDFAAKTEPKDEYKTLTRMGITFDTLGFYFLQILKGQKWERAKLISQHKGYNSISPNFCYLASSAIAKHMTAKRFRYEEHIWLENNQDAKLVLMESIGLRHAVVVLCANPDSVRDIMIQAEELNFNNGEYVFLNIDLFSSKNASMYPWYRANDTAESNEKARKAYESLMTVSLRKPTSPEYENFSREVISRAKSESQNFTYGEDEVNSFVGAFHDAVILYALAINETLAANESISNGTAITRRMWNRTFEGITGTVSIDENGDRSADYSLLDMDPLTGKFEVVANYFGNKKQYVPVPNRTIHWAGGRKSPPPDTPTCGYNKSKCPPDEPFPEYGIVVIVLGVLLIIVMLTAFFIYRRISLEAELDEKNWRVRWEDIMYGPLDRHKRDPMGSRQSIARRQSMTSAPSVDTLALDTHQVFTRTGYYKGSIVALKRINKTSITINRQLKMDIKRIKDAINDHIVRFVGVCLDLPNQSILTEYCPKGSLQDILENDEIKLDWMFRYSLMQDIVRGLAYLHGSEIKSHGNLKSSNCVVDSRFVLKITDFGLHSLRGNPDLEEENTFAYYHRKLWTSPELLRLHNPPEGGSQKSDVYSFSIMCQEIIYRNGVFYLNGVDLSAQEIYQKVKDGLKPAFRPTLDYSECPSEDLVNLIKKCWSEDPNDRPDMQSMKQQIKKMNKDGDKGNLLDNLLSRMEQYANNLEALVEERTGDFLEQKKRAEDLLYSMLPKSVAGALIRGETVQAEEFESVTLFFSDICGFTAMSAESTPHQVVALLNDLYTMFDSTIEQFDVYKVETIGDAYMVASGLPVRNGNLHAREIARMSLALLRSVLSFKIRHRPNDQLKLRIGLHTGPVCSGVVGLKMPRYCLFGDTVNTCSRMESNGLPLKIHVSPHTKSVLDIFGTFDLELRGAVEMKGKGSVTTYWLRGEIQPDGTKTEAIPSQPTITEA